MSFRPIILACALLLVGALSAQVSVPANQGLAGDFVGWDNDPANNFPLEIRHDLNEQIEWWTDGTKRMRLRETLLNQVVNGLPPTDLSGHLGIGFVSDRPLTYLHISRQLGGDPDGYRTWMRTGLLAQDSLYALTLNLCTVS